MKVAQIAYENLHRRQTFGNARQAKAARPIGPPQGICLTRALVAPDLDRAHPNLPISSSSELWEELASVWRKKPRPSITLAVSHLLSHVLLRLHHEE
jgi:hypothetical protein